MSGKPNTRSHTALSNVGRGRDRSASRSSTNSSLDSIGSLNPTADAETRTSRRPSNFDDATDEATMTLTDPPQTPDMAETLKASISAIVEPMLAAFLQQQQQMQQQMQNFFDAAAAQQAAPTNIPSQPSRSKVNLPAFSADNIEIWIGSSEAAFTTAGITEPKFKRSAILAAIPTKHITLFKQQLLDTSAASSTADGYEELLAHLRTMFAEKQPQRAARFMKPHNLRGLTPTQFLATLQAQVEDITMEDLIKEVLAGVLPPHVRNIVKKDTATAAEMAIAADSFFSTAGELLSPQRNDNINAIGLTPTAYDDEQTDTAATVQEQTEGVLETQNPSYPPTYADVVNALNKRAIAQPRARFTRPNQFARAPRQRQQAPFQPRQQRPQQRPRFPDFARTYITPPDKTCLFHAYWGNNAFRCLGDGCPQQGNVRAGGQ